METRMSDYGRDELMVVAAVRYCIGRTSYIVSDCCDWLIKIWMDLLPNTRAVIQRDIDEAFEKDNSARAEKRNYRPLGWDCYRKEWERVRKLWS